MLSLPNTAQYDSYSRPQQERCTKLESDRQQPVQFLPGNPSKLKQAYMSTILGGRAIQFQVHAIVNSKGSASLPQHFQCENLQLHRTSWKPQSRTQVSGRLLQARGEHDPHRTGTGPTVLVPSLAGSFAGPGAEVLTR